MHNIAFKNKCDLPCRHIMFKFIAINARLWKLSHKKSYAFDVTTTNDSVHYANSSSENISHLLQRSFQGSYYYDTGKKCPVRSILQCNKH